MSKKNFLMITCILFSSIGNISCAKHKKANNNGDAYSKLDSKLPTDAAMIFIDRANNYWFSSGESGIIKYDGKDLENFTTDDKVCSYRILSVQEDGNGNLYFDTPDCVNKYDGKSFSVVPISDVQDEESWSTNPDDLLFRMGWDHGGPFRLSGDELVYMPLPPNPYEKDFRSRYPNISYNPYGVYSLYKDNKGHIWIGTSSLGLYMFDGNRIYWSYESHWTDTPSGGAFGIRSVIQDADGYYWICNMNNKYRLELDQTSTSELPGIPLETDRGVAGPKDLYFLNMQSDKQGNLWLFDFEEGLWQYDGLNLKHIQLIIDGSVIVPTSMFIDKEDVVWLATKENGPYQYKSGKFSKFKLNP